MKIAGKAIFGTILCGLSYLLGGWDKALEVLVICVTIDYISGVLSAIIRNVWNYKTGLIGIARKVVIFFVVMLAVQVEKLIGQDNTIRPLIIYFYVGLEIISSIKNIKEIGVTIPGFFTDKLQSIFKLNSSDNKEQIADSEVKGDG